ncbi:MAG: thiamine phosphate synthase [Ruminococcus flavefaciens]|nr:thiamine phosphate synthase [Ruminococcus flavefaciens]
MKFNKDMLKLYAVTDRTNLKTSLETAVEQAIQGGTTCVQLREKNISFEEYVSRAVEIRKVCHAYGVPLIINDDYRVALASSADGVHVGAEDTAVAEIRKHVGENFIIGATAKTIQQAQKAQSEGADYLGVGAVFPSPTKTNAIRITPEILTEICKSVSIPVVAIGGISLENVHIIKGCGQSGIAVVSALFAQEDVKLSAERLRAEL